MPFAIHHNIHYLVLLFLANTIIVSCCQSDNKQMHACLHTYLERDFSIVEELLRRPPYGQNGHILIEQSELEHMCSRLAEMSACYEHMIQACVAFDSFSHMKRVIKTIRAVNDDLCGNSFRIRLLIEGGYCIEYARKESNCSLPFDNSAQDNVAHISAITLPSKKYQWPYTLTSMLRFELGKNICSYLVDFNQCLVPFIERRCRMESRDIWNSSIQNIIHNWCNNQSQKLYSPTILLLTSISYLLISIYF